MPAIAKSIAVGKALAAAVYFRMHKRPLSFWDVGARWGLSRPMECLYRAGVIRPLFFEPDPDEAARLSKRYRRSSVFNCALSDMCGDATLYLTNEPGGSSLLKPINSGDVVRTKTVSTIRADMLNTEKAIRPEVVKLDIQGSELAALRGFGELLADVVCLEIEVSFARTYESQPLCDDIAAFLMTRGFGLFDIQVFGVRSTRGAMHANAFYIRRDLRGRRDIEVDRVFRALNGIVLAA